MAQLKAYNATNAALVAMWPRTGEVLAMVGSVDYFDPVISGQVNVALAERQPGSSFKPFVFLTALNPERKGKRYTLASLLDDTAFEVTSGGEPSVTGMAASATAPEIISIKKAKKTHKDIAPSAEVAVRRHNMENRIARPSQKAK